MKAINTGLMPVLSWPDLSGTLVAAAKTMLNLRNSWLLITFHTAFQGLDHMSLTPHPGMIPRMPWSSPRIPDQGYFFQGICTPSSLTHITNLHISLTHHACRWHCTGSWWRILTTANSYKRSWNARNTPWIRCSAVINATLVSLKIMIKETQ